MASLLATGPQAFAGAVELAVSSRSLLLGRSTHAQIIKSLYPPPVPSFLSNHLINMYAKLDLPSPAFLLLSLDPSPSVVSFTALISGAAQNNRPLLALNLFPLLLRSSLRPNDFTLPSLLKAAASLRCPSTALQLHAFSLKSGLISDAFVISAAVNMYHKTGLLSHARHLFDEMPRKTIVAWNAVMTNAVLDGFPEAAVSAFIRLRSAAENPNEVSFCAFLNACASLEYFWLGSQLHSFIIRFGFDTNVSVGNALVDFYGKCACVAEARQVFDSLSTKNDVSWCSIIVVHAQNAEEEEAFHLYLATRAKGFIPTDFMLSSILTTCSGLSGLNLGLSLHAVAVRSCIDGNIFVGSALVDMYGKCGSIEEAEQVFDGMSERNLVTWNAMLSGYAAQGNASVALRVFDEMRRGGGVEPNYVTLVSLMSACARGGRLKEGMELFEKMEERYGIKPRNELYACVVDLLGRAGMEEKAYEIIRKMPMKPSVSVWGALLNACRIHGKEKLGRIAAEELFELDPHDSGNHVLLSNIFASAGRWEESISVRKEMKDVGIKKEPGCSWITWKNEIHVFQAKDTRHERNAEIQCCWRILLLADLRRRMAAAGYTPDTRFALYELEDEEKESEVYQHSEKLALAFGLLCIPQGMAIRINKNLRVCGDCHEAIKFVSGIVGREIIVRDNVRFHRFRDCRCSCGDYW
ncbi:LOW QUALITY PROTEIN: pentatricopeptide repeat-containing protein At4g14850-like [Phalaenopsis equestris]|uniref:LOW QUALITY PROTEIN: pentatricopeptide repeat-containing protein At4g14850-like n=1 Tax=Phalaenopsis equestris TaxID=78828 RepID=UPI0009E59120|nr:LOW QUALITY PROTEIN: pentatricopeptide repeat-containing protein At4g14850-like [Phalaenopsis equestris]